MARSGVSFTENERREMKRVFRINPSLMADTDDEYWRNYFDTKRKKWLGDKVVDKHWRGEIVSAERVRDDCNRVMYLQTKAGMFDILEFLFSSGPQLDVIKSCVEYHLACVSANLDVCLKKSLPEGLKISK